ncbi:MAG TPA: hypothetical protein PLO90_02940 [Clostridia bacterium]|jgi:hypothetical protein|nr:hypothetical protein [Clostridia bacterium]HPY43301.1 hypothetical protein [Clostridia bacterium]HQA97074.1 hypothetical protein [Clostridia bacterium]HUM60472.1 hypothetical protein [Clostridia bacterium]
MKKRKTLKWLVVFATVLLVSLFFSRTVQTITTPKIQKISATRGRLEEKIPLPASLNFSQGEEVYIQQARKMNLSITEVLAQQGFYVKEGDLLARAEMPAYQEELDKLKLDYDKAVRELSDHLLTNVRLAKDSPHNQLEDSYYDAVQVYYDLRMKTQEKAAALSYELPEDINAWGRAPEPEVTPRPQANPTPSPVPLAQMPDEMKDIMQSAYEAWLASEEIYSEVRRVYIGSSKIRRTPQATFDYIKKIYDLRRALDTQSKNMLEFVQLSSGMDEIRAPHNGYLISFTLKKGDAYDGSKALYTISKQGELPTLKVDITDIKKTIAQGASAELEGVPLTVSEISLEAMGKKYAIIALNEDTISRLGGIGKLISNPLTITLLYKAQRTTTLLPASAVRTDSDGSSYVFAVQQNWGGLLGNMQYILKKQSITVLEKSNRQVAISEDLSYMEIADREDRMVSDGQVVMEYVD